MELLELRRMIAAMLISCFRGSLCVEGTRSSRWQAECVQREFLELPEPVRD